MKILLKQIKVTKEETQYRQTRIDRLGEEIVKTARQCHQHDDTSRMAPGKRDTVTPRSSEGKEKIQKRHLYMSIKETRSCFLKEYQEIKIGLTKFRYLRPEHVKFSSGSLLWF